MLTRAKKFYTKMVSFLTATTMALSTTIFGLTFSVTTASAASTKEYTSEELSEMANEAAYLLNEERKAAGLNPLYVVPYLNECAEIRAKEQSELEGHFRPIIDENTGEYQYYSEIIDWKILSWLTTSENITLGSTTAEEAISDWKASSRHWTAAMHPEYTHTGIAVFYDPNSKYKWQWVQIFTNDVDPRAVYENQYLPQLSLIVPAGVGDINGDATINTFDYIGLVEYIRKSKDNIPVYLNDAQLEAADCFKDGIITETDATALKKYILGEYKSLPYEFK